MRLSAVARLGVLGLSAFFLSPVLAENAAHDLANRFADGGKDTNAASDEARRKAYEMEMLERARREAGQQEPAFPNIEDEFAAKQKALEAQREAESRALAEKLKRAEEARKVKTAEDVAGTPGETPFKPALTFKDKAAKPETEEKGAARAPVVVTPPLEPSAVARGFTPAERPADQAAEPAPSPPAMAMEPRIVPPRPSERTFDEPPPMALGRPAVPREPESGLSGESRVTILLVMEPGKKGIRRFNKTADPVICEGRVCFISNGPDTPARSVSLHKALGPGNTFGKRAGACRSKLTCVFRGVTLIGESPTIQPVDLKVLVHDRREPRAVSGDASCRVSMGKLACGRTIVAPNYRAWIVPERVANEAGPAALEAAVVRGLAANPLREAAVR